MKLLSSLLYSLGATGLLLLVAPAVQAQTGIGNLNPDASSVLDITSSNRGLLIPRVALTGVSDGGTILNPATSLLVYNTSAAIAGPGFYFNSGTSGAPNWERFVSSAAPVGLDFWRTTGNAGTNPATSFMGTTDGQDLAFRVGNIERMRLRQDGTLNLLNALTVGGPAALFSAIVTNGVTVGGTLGVTGATSLAGLSAGATTVNGTLNVSGAPTFGALSGSGNRLVVADASGNLITQAIPAPGDAILNQNTIDQIANFRITGTGRVGGALSAGSTLGVTGATTLNSTLGVTGNTSLTTLGTSGLATLATAKVSNLNGTGNRVVVAAPDGTLTTAAVVGGTGDYIQNQSANTQPASFNISGSGVIGNGLDVIGKTVITGDFKVAGSKNTTELYATTIGKPSDKSNLLVNGDLNVTVNTGLNTLNTSGLATLASAIVNGTLNVTGTSTLGNLSAGTTTLGSTSLASAKVTNLTGTGSRVVVAASDGTLAATSALPGTNNEFILNQTSLQTGNFNISGTGRIGSTLNVIGATSLSTLGTSGLATLNSASVTTSLGVTGTSNLGILSAGATTLNSAGVTTTLGVTGATNLGNTLTVAGNTSLSTLGTSGLATLNTAKVANLIGTGNRVVVAAADGTLTTATAVGGTSDYIQNQNTSDQGANFRINGTGQIGGTLNVGGTTTLVGLNAGATSVSTLSTSGLATLSSATVSNALSAGATTLSSATVTNGLTAGTTTVKSARITDFTATNVPATRLVVTNANGDLTTGAAVPGSNNEFISNSGTPTTQAFNIGGAGQIGGTLTVAGTSNLGTLNAGATTLNSASVTTTLGVTGATTLSSTLGVIGNTNLSTLGTSGLATLASATVNGTFNAPGTSTLGTLSAGTTTLGATSLSAARVTGLNGSGNRVVVAAPDGTLTTAAAVAGGTVEYVQNQSSTDQGASFRISGNGQIGGTLNVAGGSTLNGLTAGTTSLGTTNINSTLSAGATTLISAVVNNGLTASGTTQLNGNLNVTGNSALAGLSAGSTTLASAAVNGALSGGTLAVAGATTLNSSLAVTGASRFVALGGNGDRLVATDGLGNLSTLAIPSLEAAIKNQTAVQSGNFNINGSGQVGSLIVNSTANISGKATLLGDLSVAGTTGVAALNASGLATLNTAKVGNLVGSGSRVVVAAADGTLVAGTATGNGADFIANTGTAAAPAFDVPGTGRVGSNLTVGGTTNLAGLNAGSTSLGATTISSTLGVTGNTTLAALSAGATTVSSTLAVTGTPTFGTLGGTGTRMVVADVSGNLTTQAIPAQVNPILNQSSVQAADFNISGTGRVGSTFEVGTALTVGSTLGVNNNATVGGTLNVTGATNLGNELTVAGNIVPGGNLYNLGAEANRWNIVYANTMFTSNGLVQTSDARLKTNITGLGYGMSTVMAMRPVRYAWKKTPDQTNKIGFIAQELQKVVPEVVSVGTDANQTMGVNYVELVPVLVKALQEQQAQLDTMRGRAEKAEAAVQSFESRLRALEAGTPVNATAQGQR